MLVVENLHVFYGGIHALKGITFNVPQGKIVTLIGANGAGKTTTLKAICGLVDAKGSIRLDDVELVGKPTHEIVRMGVSMVPEGRRVFPNLTVMENLLMGAYHRDNRDEVEEDLRWIFELFPRLKERAWQKAGTLSGGEQQMLALGRALMSRPKLLMMDEPSLGLAPLLVREVFEVIKHINEEGRTILLIEQNARAALKIAHYGYVLETGKITMEGTGSDLLNDDRVRKVYLGES